SMSVLSCHGSVEHQVRHSFPTRRSSDLEQRGVLQDRHLQRQNGLCGRGIVPGHPGSHLSYPGQSLPGRCGAAFLRSQLRSCRGRSEEHTSELQSRENLVCRLLLETKNGK